MVITSHHGSWMWVARGRLLKPGEPSSTHYLRADCPVFFFFFFTFLISILDIRSALSSGLYGVSCFMIVAPWADMQRRFSMEFVRAISRLVGRGFFFVGRSSEGWIMMDGININLT